MTVTTATDELLRRAATGDRAAFAAFYDATAGPAYRLALATCGDPADAEEAVAGAYAAAWRDLARRDPDGAARGGLSPQAWLCTLVREQAQRSVRERQPVPRAS